MRKVRIGNDICISVSLSTKYFKMLNIRSIKAYLVNTTLQSNINNRLNDVYDEYDTAVLNQQGRIKYISRFPIEPMSDCYHSTLYDICNSGCPTYNVRPFCWKPVYNGFGVHPHTFDGFRNHLWAYDDFRNIKEKIHRTEDMNKFDSRFISYKARVEFEGGNTARIYFPGADLKYEGIYQVIIVTEVYVTGYSNYTNIKTLTLDYDNAFEIVSSTSEEGLYGDRINIILGVQNTDSEIDPDTPAASQDLYVDPTLLYGTTSNTTNGVEDVHINLQLTNATPIPIDISEEVGWYENNEES